MRAPATPSPIARGTGALTLLLGLFVLAGWAMDVPALKSVLRGAVEMKANTAAGLVLAGAGLIVLAGPAAPAVRSAALALAAVAAALGLATLGQYLFGWQLGIDELLFEDKGSAYNAIAGRMSPYSAVAFGAIGVALMVLPCARLRPVVGVLSAAVLAIGILNLLGYVWNASELVTDALLPPVAVHTALAFTLLGIGTLLAGRERHARPDGPVLQTRASVEFKVALGFVGAFLLLVVGGGITYRTGAEFVQSAQMVAHTQEVRTRLGKLHATVSEAESAQRDYLLTGAAHHKRAYLTFAGEARAHAIALEALEADNAAHLQLLARLKGLVGQRLDSLEETVVLHDSQGFDAARAQVATDQGTRLMDAVRALTHEMDGTEAALLVQREARAARDRQNSLVFLIITLVGAAAVFLFLLHSIRRQMLAGAHANERIERLNADLERRIEERSAALQESLEAREAADAGNRAKSVFLATMSHEIRTPMNGVLGMLELLALTRLDAEQRAALGVVRESGRSLLHIIDDILDFSKIEAGRLELRPVAASIAQVVDRTYQIYSGIASGKGLLLEVAVDPRISPALLFDPMRLGQILNNFLSNALKFTSRGGVAVTVQLLERDERQETLRISVADSGIGISAENQAGLFQPFAQAEPGTTVTYGGTGLGLAICRRLAEMMNGRIELESQPGHGTTLMLVLTLPIADAGQLPQPSHDDRMETLASMLARRRVAPSVERAQADGSLVLVVDDHPTNRAVLLHQVRALGYAAESANNGAEALDQWQSGRFGIIITDCNMPRMNGYDLARSIRRLEADGGHHVPIIACTANALGGEAEICFAAGMDDYLPKPIEISQLMKVLDRWLPVPGTGAMPLDALGSASSAPGTALAMLDRSALAMLVGADPALEQLILRDYRRSTDADAIALRRAVAAGDSGSVAQNAHRINGASKTVGAGELARVCDRVERA
ncbi:MAG TPA: ATP-binding protein, partial [Albitalea sp.]|nr:ATP-binding protein [Albitalea sp.]